MKTFKQFQEDYTRVINPVKPVTDFIGASLGAYELGKKAFSGLSNIFQARKYKTRNNPTGRVGIEKKGKRNIGDMEKTLDDKRSDGMIVAKPGEVQKQNKFIDKYEKDIQKSTEKNLKRRNFVKKLKGDKPENQFNSYDPLKEEAPTNNVGGGQIAGTVEAGDDPPVKKGRKKKKRKKKRYIYGGTGSRKMWMKKNNK